jgi:hypothetical protein
VVLLLMKKSSKKSSKWFIRIRGSYLPNNSRGWLTYLPYTLYLVGVLVYVYAKHYDTLLSVFIVVPNWVAAAAVMNWVAANHS